MVGIAGCPIERTLSVIGKKWTVLIVRELLQGTRRFNEILLALDGISPKTLSERLKELEDNGVIHRRVFPEIPPRVEYSLTRKGQSLDSVLDAMMAWGALQS